MYCVAAGAYIMQMTHGRIVIGRRVVIIARFSLSVCAPYYSYLYTRTLCVLYVIIILSCPPVCTHGTHIILCILL